MFRKLIRYLTTLLLSSQSKFLIYQQNHEMNFLDTKAILIEPPTKCQQLYM